MTLRAASGLVFPALLCACWEVTRPSLTVVEEGQPEPEPSTTLALAVSATAVVDEGPAAPLFPPAPSLKVGPTLLVSELAGIGPAAAGTMLAPAVEALERCQTTSTGKLVLRLIAEPGSTHVRLVDPGGLDASTSRCALSALGTLEVDEAIQQSWSPADAVRRVETQVVLSW